MAKLSMLWAINKGKYREGVDEKCYPKWKQTLRAAFRSTGIQEIRDASYGSGENYKVYGISSVEGNQRSPDSPPNPSSKDGAHVDTSHLIPLVVDEVRSDSFPSDLRDLDSGDLLRKSDEERSISLTAIHDPDRYREVDEPMETSYQGSEYY